jgi:hypothetical protein
LINRRAALNGLLDQLAPLSDMEIAVLSTLRRMLDAIDPQEVYAARIELSDAERDAVDTLTRAVGATRRSRTSNRERNLFTQLSIVTAAVTAGFR